MSVKWTRQDDGEFRPEIFADDEYVMVPIDSYEALQRKANGQKTKELEEKSIRGRVYSTLTFIVGACIACFVIGYCTTGCAVQEDKTPIVYDEHQGMKYCPLDKTWYVDIVADAVCKEK